MRMPRDRQSPLQRALTGGAIVVFSLLTMPIDGHAANGKSPHWKAGSCQVCHTSATPTADQLALKTSPGHAVCAECHDGGEAAVCRHRSDISVGAERIAAFDEALQPAVTYGMVDCMTCHTALLR